MDYTRLIHAVIRLQGLQESDVAAVTVNHGGRTVTLLTTWHAKFVAGWPDEDADADFNQDPSPRPPALPRRVKTVKEIS